MYAGTITNNVNTVNSYINSADYSGGGVTLTNAAFNLYGGDITGNESKLGGGVYVNGDTFSMSGGTISGNTASKSLQSGGDGGGVYIASGLFTMTAGTITGNTANARAGGVCVTDKFTMTGGNITKNSATNGGGGVFISGPSNTFTMSDGTITGNTAANGGGVYVYARTNFNVSGNVSITGNKQKSSTLADNVYLYTSGCRWRCGHHHQWETEQRRKHRREHLPRPHYDRASSSLRARRTRMRQSTKIFSSLM